MTVLGPILLILRALAALVVLVVIGGAGGPTQAATMTNRDAVERKVTLSTDAVKSEHVMKPQGVLRDVCPRGCIVRLDANADENEDYELDGAEVVFIEDGVLYYDEAASAAEAARLNEAGKGEGGEKAPASAPATAPSASPPSGKTLPPNGGGAAPPAKR